MAEGGDESMVVLDGASVPLITPGSATIPTYRQKRKQSGLWREAQATCRVFVLEISDGNILAVIRLREAKNPMFRKVRVYHDMTREEREKKKELKAQAKEKNFDENEKKLGNFYVVRGKPWNRYLLRLKRK
ncbi:hypothetical protein Pmani_026333 [Petrolisthes manimaculis]|uniref:Uncharacterized protein n=1 Tax=Petrolisthes manimaculis TaxID=1843537 RepID=A0AAE1P6B1_9EUCA|nr:hypothetical protein Pmani_026333 [Petrolisthes manimaculis]